MPLEDESLKVLQVGFNSQRAQAYRSARQDDPPRASQWLQDFLDDQLTPGRIEVTEEVFGVVHGAQTLIDSLVRVPEQQQKTFWAAFLGRLAAQKCGIQDREKFFGIAFEILVAATLVTKLGEVYEVELPDNQKSSDIFLRSRFVNMPNVAVECKCLRSLGGNFPTGELLVVKAHERVMKAARQAERSLQSGCADDYLVFLHVPLTMSEQEIEEFYYGLYERSAAPLHIDTRDKVILVRALDEQIVGRYSEGFLVDGVPAFIREPGRNSGADLNWLTVVLACLATQRDENPNLQHASRIRPNWFDEGAHDPSIPANPNSFLA